MPPKSAKKAAGTSSVSTPAQKPKSASKGTEMDHIVATIYFLEWAKNVLDLYSQKINKLFLAPLTEHCVRKKVTNATVSIDDQENSARVIETGRKLEEGLKVDDSHDEVKNLQRRLQLSKKDVCDVIGDYALVRKEKWLTLAENSVMFRLRTLVRMSGGLLIYMTRIVQWLEKHRKVFSQYERECGNVLEYAIHCFEAICVQGDIFSLEPVDRSNIRADCKKFVANKDPYTTNNKDRKRDESIKISEKRKEIEEDIKRLEAQINYYRTSVHLVCNSLTDITQAILKRLPRDVLNVTTKEVRTILEVLPPAYHFPAKFSLSAAAMTLLSKPPLNKHQLNEFNMTKLLESSLHTASNIDISSVGPKSSETRTNYTQKSSNRASSSKKKNSSVKPERHLDSEKTQSDRSNKSPTD